jgi:histidinol-phosphate aminotransferase
MKFNTELDNLKIYEAGKPIELVVRDFGIDPKDIIKLASNENPYGVSSKVSDKIKEFSGSVCLYPDDSMYQLKDGLANRFGVESQNIIIGAGSDQVIEFCVHSKCNQNSKVIMANTTFAMYEIYTKQTGATILKTSDDQHNLAQFEAIYNQNGADLIFLCLPNNPLGECLDKDDVYSFLDKIDSDTLVVVDGAYQEYARYKDSKKMIDPKDLIDRYPNCIYLGTFSKAYGFGGMRVGYGIAKDNIIQALHKLRPPFNITNLSLAGAIEALKDTDFVDDSIKANFEQMKRYEEYATSKGFRYIDSYTNFITIYLDGYDSKEISDRLLKKGVIVRDMSGYSFNAIRITIGTSDQNDRLFTILDEVLSK